MATGNGGRRYVLKRQVFPEQLRVEAGVEEDIGHQVALVGAEAVAASALICPAS